MSERHCPVCGRHFYPRTGSHRFCTPVCRERAKGEIRKLREPAKYGFTHQRTRKLVALEVAAGQARCPRCSQMILPGEPWDLDHRDDGNGYAGAAHRWCNRAAGNKRKVRADGDGARHWGPPDLKTGLQPAWSCEWYPWRGDPELNPDLR
jgi:hypothetical protein